MILLRESSELVESSLRKSMMDRSDCLDFSPTTVKITYWFANRPETIK